MSDPVDISKMAGAAGEWGETAKILVSALDRVCTPVAEEAALILRDKLHAYRVRNLVAMAKKLQPLLEDVPAGDQAPPRLAAAVMEHASWTADDQIQGMWAGLLASSCSPGARDDGNLIFIDLLSRLTAPQVRILDVVCRDVPKRAQGGLIGVQSAYLLDREQIMSISGLDDLARVDRELDHLRSIGLLDDQS